MDDEERQKLCKALRSCPEEPIEVIAWMRMAANEIERLTALVQSAEEDCDLRILNEALHADDKM